MRSGSGRSGIIGYGKQKRVKVLLWVYWGALDKQMDEALSLYDELGAGGHQSGFHGSRDQEMVNFYERLVRKAAEHHLVVDLHGAYKPTGRAGPIHLLLPRRRDGAWNTASGADPRDP